MAKKPLERVTEPSEGLVHYSPAPLQDAVTLCGKTDWLGEERGQTTDAPVTCQVCLSMVEHICRHKAERQADAKKTMLFRFDSRVVGSAEMAQTWEFSSTDTVTIEALRQAYPELDEWSDAHLLAAWGNYSQDVMAYGFADVRGRDTGLLAYLYVRQEAPHFEFGGTGLFNVDIWDLGDKEPWLTHAPLGAPFV